jgi:hypothetical protein
VQTWTVFGPYHTVLSGAEIRAVLYPYRKRTVFGRFLQLYGYNTARRLIAQSHRKRVPKFYPLMLLMMIVLMLKTDHYLLKNKENICDDIIS